MLKLQLPDMEMNLDGKTILITGGTGSFGQCFAATILANSKPKKVIVFSRDELKQHDMAMSKPFAGHSAMRYFIGDVRDVDRLELAMREVDIVVHAAALKHISAAEYNPIECIKTNVHGAENIVMAALRCGVEKVIALSTDKAASPINLYGASKLAAEKIFVAARHIAGRDNTRFSVVRYGNVVGSRGSVVPLFQKMVADGASELPLTDIRMTRFWITLQHGVELVLSSLATMKGGEIFIPKLPSMNILDVVAAIAPEIATTIVGIRPGEKLHETMITLDEARNTIELANRFVILPQDLFEARIADGNSEGRPMAEGASYSSDKNDHWMSVVDFHKLLDD